MLLSQSSVGTELGLMVIQTLAVLALIALAAWAFVRFVAPRLQGSRGKLRMRVIERLPLEQRRSLYLVEVDNTPFLIGAAEGSIRLLKELETTEIPPQPTETEKRQ